MLVIADIVPLIANLRTLFNIIGSSGSYRITGKVGRASVRNIDGHPILRILSTDRTCSVICYIELNRMGNILSLAAVPLCNIIIIIYKYFCIAVVISERLRSTADYLGQCKDTSLGICVLKRDRNGIITDDSLVVTISKSGGLQDIFCIMSVSSLSQLVVLSYRKTTDSVSIDSAAHFYPLAFTCTNIGSSKIRDRRGILSFQCEADSIKLIQICICDRLPDHKCTGLNILVYDRYCRLTVCYSGNAGTAS